MVGAVGAVAALRLIGFASTVFGANVPWMLVPQYVAVAFAVGGGAYVIQRGLIIEPPAFLNEWISAAVARIERLTSGVTAS